jgi:hypothetical protein
LLHELATYAEHSPVKELLGAVPKKGLEAAALGGQPFLLDGVLDIGDLLLDNFIVGIGFFCIWQQSP